MVPPNLVHSDLFDSIVSTGQSGDPSEPVIPHSLCCRAIQYKMKEILCCTRGTQAKKLAQRLCIIHRVTELVVVEVHIDVRKVSGPGSNPLRPTSEQSLIVVPSVFSGRAMKADVGEIRSHLHRRLGSAPVVNAKSHLVAAKEIENRRHIPALVAEFKSIAIAFGQRRKELCKP